ncbi:hypothetical protein [Facilibium subflavum]|uniref:hypothetical protein n=1 Tax=Facilibium subflavum TaxID=2219058 RepID=UPI000E656533|nr:hypothetical protein [Facilibium subflavum]
MLGMVSALFPALTGTAISIFSFIQIMGGVAFTAFGAFHLLDNVYELGLTGVTGILFALLMFIYMQRALKNNKANS